MAAPKGSDYSALILPGKPAPRKPVAEAVKAVSSPKGLVTARKAAEKALPKPAHHALLSLHTLERGASVIGNTTADIATKAYKDTYGTHGKGGKPSTRPPGLAVADVTEAQHAEDRQLASNALKDVVQMGELPFVGGLKLGQATVAGVEGDPKPLENFAKSIGEGVKHGAIGELAQGHLEGAKRAFQQHPAFTLTETAGLESAAGRTAGALTRAAGSQAERGGVRGALARAGSTVRPPIALTDDAGLARAGKALYQREYSKDLNRKGAQVLADKRREPIRDSQRKVVTVKERGRTVPVLKATGPREQEKLQANRANFEAARTQGVEILEREKARKTANQIEGRMPPVKPAMRLGQELSHLVATGTIRSAQSFKGDLEKRIRVVQDAIAHPEHYRTVGTKASPGELRAARGNLKMLQKAAKSPRILKAAPQIVQNGLKYAEALNKGDIRLGDLHVHPPEELQRAALSEYALAHMNAKHAEVDGEAALRSPSGKILTNEDIRRHAARNGRAPDSLAYVPHVIGAGRKSSFHQPFRPGGRPVAPGLTRTGALFNRGATAFGSEMVREELTKKGVVASNAQAIDKFIGESGLKRPDGQHFNAKEGLETAARLNADGTTEYLPVRAFAAKLDRETREKLAGEQNSSAMETAHEAMLNDRIVKAGDQSKARNVVLVPKTQLDTLMRHLKPAGEFERTLQLLNAPFRMAVLPQPRWLTGNFLEPYVVRLPLSGAGINIPGSAVDMAAATKVVQGMERSGDARMVRAAQEVRGMQMGGMFVGRRGASVRRTYQDFSGNMERFLKSMHDVRNFPVFRQMGDLVLTVPHTFFNVNRVIESTAQRIALGKAAREDIQQFTGSWLKTVTLGKKALEEVQKGLVDTPTQHRFMERQYELLGQYDGFKPGLRKAVQTAFPFLPWTLNSLRFVYWTLPVHHSAAFTAFAKAAQHVQAEWEAEHKDIPPGTLSDALVRGDKGLVDIARYTPFGITIPMAHGQVEGLPSTFMPQLSGSQEALSGKDPFGRPLQVPKTPSNPKGEATPGQKLGIALNSAAESMIPLLAMGRRIQEGGGTSYSNSTVFSPKAKPETSHGMSAFDRTLNPFRPTYIKPKSKSKGLGSGLSSGLGSGLGTGLK